MILDTNIVILLVEKILLGVEDVIVKTRGEIVMEKLATCTRVQCYVSELSKLEFVKVGLSKLIMATEYRNVLGQGKPVDKLNQLFDSLLHELRNSGLKIELVKLNDSDVEKAQGIANKLKWDERAIRQRSFDVFILAQALNRGIKVFTMDEGFLDIRKRVLPPTQFSEGPRKTGSKNYVRIYEDPYLLVIR